jgi:hypothetical protein
MRKERIAMRSLECEFDVNLIRVPHISCKMYVSR